MRKSRSSGRESMAVIVLRSYGQRSMLPSSVMYQELHPVFHTVGPSAAATSSLNFVVACSVTSTVVNSPALKRRNHSTMYFAVNSAEKCSGMDPVGELGPSTVKKFGKPGIAVIRYARGPFDQASLMVSPSRPRMFIGRM